jgi:hypothetical protein
MTLMMLSILCMHLFGDSSSPKLDESPAKWARSAFAVGDKSVTISVPRGHRYESQDPRPRGAIDLDRRKWQLMDAQYDFGCGENADLPDFRLILTIIRYPAAQAAADVDISDFAPLYAQAFRTSVIIPREPRPSSNVVLGGRSWLALKGEVGVTGYATPLSRTHALTLDAAFPSAAKHDAAWYAQRLDTLKRVAENIVITDQTQ